MTKETCHDCGAEEGDFHVPRCDMERCPFCKGQLITCDCRYEKLGLYDSSKYGIETSHLPPNIYEEGLASEQQEKWSDILEEKGLVPYIRCGGYICALCGSRDDAFFMVPDEEWEQQIPKELQEEIICKSCYENIDSIEVNFHCSRCGAPDAEFDDRFHRTRFCPECRSFVDEAFTREEE
jgi:hypothetical protein